jgi:arylsulfatase
MGWKLNHYKIALIVAFFLSSVTVIATYIAGNWNTRAIYNIFYITFLNITILTLNSILFTKSRPYLGERRRKFFRIGFIIVYSTAYLCATGTFIGTGQATRIQTLLFLSQTHSTIVTAAIIGGIILGLLAITTLFYKIDSISPAEKKERDKLKIAFYIGLSLFALTILVNAYYLQIEEPIITDHEALAKYNPEILNLQEKVLNINFTMEKPNVIFILLESVSANKIGFYGRERNVTPTIDELAEKGIVFMNAYSTATHSDYAQPALLSSRYTLTNQYRTISADDNPKKFIWDIFKENNYTTGYYSSQNDLWENIETYINYTNFDNYTNSLTDGKTDYGSGRQSKDFDFRTTERAITWLNETIGKNESFFLYLNFQATHPPFAYPEEYSFYQPDEDNGMSTIGFGGKDTQNIYDNAIRYVDAQIRQILDFIEKNNETENTVIIITADHGHDLENLHEIGGHGNTLYDEGLLVPAIFFFPGIEHQIIKDRVSHIDFVPTTIDILGYKIPDEFQGKVMIKGRPIFSITQAHKYLIGIILNNTKIIADMNREIIEIYELDKDPRELNNIKYDKSYKEKTLRLLLWNYCQKDYYEKERWKTNLYDRCASINNFKI